MSRINSHFSSTIEEMKKSIIENLAELDLGYGRRKKYISKQTGVPEDILTVLLKQLKYDGKVELIMTWDEDKGIPAGSGYCIPGRMAYAY